MRRSAVVAAFLCILLVPALGVANILPWQFDGDNILRAQWEWSILPGQNPVEWSANPPTLSEPLIRYDFGGTWKYYIDADNYPDANPIKTGWLAIGSVYDFSALNPSITVTTGVPNAEIEVGGITYTTPANNLTSYYIAYWEFTIEPNPCGEEIYLNLDWAGIINADGTNLANCAECGCGPKFFAQLETQCAVPIPGAIWLFGAGLLGLVGFRKRFKK